MSNHQETIRHAVLAVLASRPGVALAPDGIARRIRSDQLLDSVPTPEQIHSAAVMLVDMQLLKGSVDPLGSSIYYSATAAGILHFERGNTV